MRAQTARWLRAPNSGIPRRTTWPLAGLGRRQHAQELDGLELHEWRAGCCPRRLEGGPARAEVAVEERPAIRAVIEEPDPHHKVALYAATQPGIHRRAGPLLRALRDAKASDPELAKLWGELEAWRRDGQARFVDHLRHCGVLRRDRTAAEASDILWTLSSLAVYDLLVVDREWTAERYGAWLAAALTLELVDE